MSSSTLASFANLRAPHPIHRQRSIRPKHSKGRYSAVQASVQQLALQTSELVFGPTLCPTPLFRHLRKRASHACAPRFRPRAGWRPLSLALTFPILPPPPAARRDRNSSGGLVPLPLPPSLLALAAAAWPFRALRAGALSIPLALTFPILSPPPAAQHDRSSRGGLVPLNLPPSLLTLAAIAWPFRALRAGSLSRNLAYTLPMATAQHVKTSTRLFVSPSPPGLPTRRNLPP